MKFRLASGWKWLVALGAVFVPALVMGAIDLPYTFKAGTPIKASEMNANFDALKSRIDALSAPAPVDVGSVTIAGILTDAPIHKFSSSVDVPFSGGAAAGKPVISGMTFERDVGDGSVALNLDASKRTVIKDASFTLGSLKIDLTGVVVSRAAITQARADKPQEAFSLSFTDVKWTWQPPNQPAVLMTWNVPNSTGGSAALHDFSLGYFPTGLPVDDTHLPIFGYTHDVRCAVEAQGCKPAHNPLVVQRPVSVETLYELGAALTSKAGHTLELDWFNADGSVNNNVSLPSTSVSSVSISTAADGSLVESTGFAYQQIEWNVGNTTGGWDVLKQVQL